MYFSPLVCSVFSARLWDIHLDVHYRPHCLDLPRSNPAYASLSLDSSSVLDSSFVMLALCSMCFPSSVSVLLGLCLMNGCQIVYSNRSDLTCSTFMLTLLFSILWIFRYVCYYSHNHVHFEQAVSINVSNIQGKATVSNNVPIPIQVSTSVVRKQLQRQITFLPLFSGLIPMQN